MSTLPHVLGLRCRECGARYPEAPQYVCDECFGPLEVEYDYDYIRAHVTRERIASGPWNLWRYADLLPVAADKAVGIPSGFTPLLRADRLGRALGLKHLYIKNDTVNPTYSFKDRVVSMAISKAVEFGFDTIGCASTGNLANSVAAHAARAGIRAFVFIPSDLEWAKINASLVYGPTLVAVDGTYDDVNRLCAMLADEYGWAFVNVNVRPYYSEGGKTLGYEVAEQLGWRAPDHVVVPMASGSVLTKITKGLDEFKKLGLIDNRPTRVSGAQAAGCSPIVNAFVQGKSHAEPVKPNTIAKSLAIGSPADAPYALRIFRETGGAAEVATDDEVIEGICLLAETEGIFAETAGGVTIAVLKKLAQSGRIAPDEVTVAYVTGNGLKTSIVLEGRLAEGLHIKPTLRSFEAALSERQERQAA
ncbi:MAG: threonine synthase [Anaerolineae bacterium]|nr:threonine synthase [Anaerolineae bacterium]